MDGSQRGWFEAALEQPTQQLPIVEPPAKVEARAVLVYQQEPRRRWGLVVFTGLMVALTAGVILGQTSAYQPPARAATLPAAQPAVPTPAVVPTPATVPLGTARKAVLEVTGGTESVRVSSTDLGDLMLTAAAPGPVTAAVRDTPEGPVIEVPATGIGNVEILLHSSVTWTVRLRAQATRHDVDLRGGGAGTIELAGAAAYATVELPRPDGRIPVRVTGSIGDLRVGTGGAPARLRLTEGATSADLGGKSVRDAKPGTTLRSDGWTGAKKRYDIEVTARPGAVAVV